MTLLVLMLAAFLASAVGTAVVRHYALTRSVLDIPNDRSSHTTPTPRGGGVAIVIAFLAGTVALWMVHSIRRPLALALLGAGALVALVGFIDDHRHIAARWRLLAHFAAAAWALAWLGGLPPVGSATHSLDLGLTGDVIAAIGLVWLLNLYNFMDGIDGIAGVEAVTVCVGSVVVYAASSAGASPWQAPALLAAAAFGFLLWNFPPARIFMGDAGSGFLGLALGILSLDAAHHAPQWLWIWMILLGAFIVDATITLLFRLRRGEKLYQAHRSHAYQHATQREGSHRIVTLAVAAINLLWLLPWALLVGAGRVQPGVGVAIAYAPLVWLALRYDAGQPGRR